LSLFKPQLNFPSLQQDFHELSCVAAGYFEILLQPIQAEVSHFFLKIEDHIMKWGLVIITMGLGIITLTLNAYVMADEIEENMNIQFILAQMTLEEKDPDVQDDDYELLYLGVAAQQPLNENRLTYGLETGALLTWDNETRHIRASGGSSGGSATIVIENQMFLFDYFFGGFVSVEFARRLRIYAGAGPLIVYGSRGITPEEEEEEEDTSQETESGTSLGVYARAGLEFEIVDNLRIGAGLRSMTSNLEFEDESGKIRVEGTQYYISISVTIN
jgi:opacity protein-like surface antigen